VRTLTDKSGVSQLAVSKHLAVLKLAGLVRNRHKGRQTYYSARPQGLAPLIDWMSFYASFWHARFDRLQDLHYGPMTQPTGKRSIVIEKEMPHPPEKNWRALTQGPLIEEWLMKNDFQPVVGQRLSYSWNASGEEAATGLTTIFPGR
jgi:hypothetical protein